MDNGVSSTKAIEFSFPGVVDAKTPREVAAARFKT